MGKKKAGPEASKAVVMAPAKGWGKKRLLLVLVAVVLLAAAAGAAYWVRSNDEASNSAPTETAAQKKLQQDIDKAEELRGSRDYDGAKAIWQDYVDGDYDNEQKYRAYLKLGALDETKGDCSSALNNYRQAEKLGTGEWRAENEAIARCSEKTGDLRTALTYYQKTLDTFPGGEEYSSDLRYYRNKIAKLKQQLGEQ